MSRLLRFFFCCLIYFTAILTFPENFLGQGFSERKDGTNFLAHSYRLLNVKASVSVTVHDAMACALECLRHGFCFSFNFAVSPPGRHGCQLLREDKYTFSDRFEPSQFYHHYSMVSPCEYSPCTNGAPCLPLYRSNSYFCMPRPAGKIEQGAPWSKLNSGEVCFGAKNSSYGKFNITSNGIIMALKLEYISGFVTCNTKNVPYGSHWNCKKGSNIGTIVTNAYNKVIFPHNYQRKVYSLPGYHENSSELIFYRRFLPVLVTAGDQYRLWYHEDFVDGDEDNNDGHTCVNVYALFMW